MEKQILSQLTQIFGQTWIVLPLFGISVFVASLFGGPIIYNYMSEKSLNAKSEIERLFDLMYTEVEDKKLLFTLLLLSYGLGAAVFLLFWPNVMFGFFAGVASIFAGIKVPVIYITNMYEKRCNKVVEQMVDGMTIMANGIKAGLSVTQSMERVVQNMKGPLPQEMNMVLNKIRLGMTVEDALNEFADRVPRQDVQMLVTAINILKETGGNLAETFQTINSVVRERQKVEKKIEAMTAQGTMQGIIISAVPFVLLGIFQVMDPKFIEPLFTTTAGMLALLGVFVLVVIGGVVIKKIVTIKV
jgi:tight adherence protein B